ncbi:MAG: hypothetical protein R3E01_31770 [Pirellulaceae bacterium]
MCPVAWTSKPIVFVATPFSCKQKSLAVKVLTTKTLVIKEFRPCLSWKTPVTFAGFSIILASSNRFLHCPPSLPRARRLPSGWAVLREAGDILAPLIDTFPVRLVSGDCEPEAVLQQQAVAKGIPFDALLRLLPFLIQLVQLLTGNQTEQPLDGPHTEGA